MKLKLDFSSLSLWQVIASWIPFKSKRYIKKWLKMKDAWIQIYSDDWLKARIVLNPECMVNQVYGIQSANTRGISMLDLWDNLLDAIAEIENMRNAEELKIWLDTQII